MSGMRWEHMGRIDGVEWHEIAVMNRVYAMVRGFDDGAWRPALQVDESTTFEGPEVNDMHEARRIAIEMATSWLYDELGSFVECLGQLGGAW